jgi:hypothetical protein
MILKQERKDEIVNVLPSALADSAETTLCFVCMAEAEEIDGRQLLRGGFRGRGLTGTEVKLPEGYTGHVLHPTNAAASTAAAGEEGQHETEQGQEQQQRGWASAATFGGFVYWNHEARPLETDAQMRVMEWLPLAKQVNLF